MRYILMCGGNYSTYWTKPRHLSKVDGEVLVERTIRLLKKNGIEDISISTNYDDFEYLGVPLLKHENNYRTEGKEVKGYWCDAFYPTNEPVCYLFGDVYFSEEAIKTIVETETDDIEFFASKPPFDKNYPKNHVEPFALKVVNTKHLKEAIEKTKQYEDEGKFWRKPIMWELWTIIKDVPLQKGPDDEYIYNYVPINDYTSDIDRERDIEKLERIIGGIKMVKCEVIEKFTLGKFNEIKEKLIRKDKNFNEEGCLYVGDVFECDENMAKYLTGENHKKISVVKVIEIIPSVYEAKVVDTNKVEVKAIDENKIDNEITKKEVKKTTTRKRTSKKK